MARFMPVVSGKSREMTPDEITEHIATALCPVVVQYDRTGPGSAMTPPHDHKSCQQDAARVCSAFMRLDLYVVPGEMLARLERAASAEADQQYVQESVQQAAQYRQEGDHSVDAG